MARSIIRIWNGNVNDCIQPSELFLTSVDFQTLWLLDTYECCCQVASTPGLEGAWTGFEGSPCEIYLDEIGFISINENKINNLDGIYIDIYGRQYNSPPKGLYIMNKTKYYRL